MNSRPLVAVFSTKRLNGGPLQAAITALGVDCVGEVFFDLESPSGPELASIVLGGKMNLDDAQKTFWVHTKRRPEEVDCLAIDTSKKPLRKLLKGKDYTRLKKVFPSLQYVILGNGTRANPKVILV